MIDVLHRDRDALYRFALGILRDRAEAEDALQDAFLRIASMTADEASPIENPRAWVFRVLRNLCIDRIRFRRRMQETRRDPQFAALVHPVDSSVANPETRLVAGDALARVTSAMDRLPPDEAEVLSLVVSEGLSYAETAYVTGVPVGTVRSRLHRARRMLRAMLDDPKDDARSERP